MIERLLWKLHRDKLRKLEQQTFLNPQAHEAMQQLSRELSSETDTKAPRLIARLLEVEETVKRLRPTRVVEIGSGRSTVAFALLGEAFGFSHVAYEQSEKWVAVVNQKIAKFAPDANSKVELAGLVEYRNGGYLEHELQDCDLLYIDRPTVSRGEQPFETFTGKPCYYDAVRYLDAGIFPKVIMVEGRTDSVDAILESPHAKKYDFQGEIIWAAQRKKWLQMAALRRHSKFVLR